MNILSHIGFPETDEINVEAFLKKNVSHISKIPTSAGDYLRYRDSSGGEIYFQRSPDGRLVGYNIHFAGNTSIPASIVHKVEKKESLLDAALFAWAAPKVSGNPESGLAPFVFEVPDYYAHSFPHPFPFEISVQLAAFPYKPLAVFESMEEYHASPEGASRISSISFIPSGLFIKSSEFESSALITGKVFDYALLTNHLTNERFHHLVVETSIGKIDVVCHKSFLMKDVTFNTIVSGEFYLSGKMLM